MCLRIRALLQNPRGGASGPPALGLRLLRWGLQEPTGQLPHCERSRNWKQQEPLENGPPALADHRGVKVAGSKVPIAGFALGPEPSGLYSPASVPTSCRAGRRSPTSWAGSPVPFQCTDLARQEDPASCRVWLHAGVWLSRPGRLPSGSPSEKTCLMKHGGQQPPKCVHKGDSAWSSTHIFPLVLL